ncbi:hypothetical protein LLS1_33060 [Leifsonia sp. LS1]|uniref:hypothetical protein n=1 Tax=Leifsonia sp. LS1 TaxID=2828483 RepID=UPI001CFE2143|nr:hypothetical protein [Leifsonia sp. LS1]GIT81637.1 hypothetical protein LLS1_33060 [Leifsonia sp. LS1]
MSHRRATALIVVILVLVGVALVAFGTWAVMNGETGAGHGAGLDAGPSGMGVAAAGWD